MSQLSTHQLRSTLLGMHATRDARQAAGVPTRPAQQRRIEEYEDELQTRAPELWSAYVAERDQARAQRRQAARLADPATRAHTAILSRPAPTATAAPAAPPDLPASIDALLDHFTLGAIIEATWDAERARFGTLPATVRPKRINRAPKRQEATA